MYLVGVSKVAQKEACSDIPATVRIERENQQRAVGEDQTDEWKRRVIEKAHQRAFALKRVNALVEDHPSESSNRKHPQPHQGAEQDRFLHPLRSANGSGLLGHLGQCQDRYDETEVLACPA